MATINQIYGLVNSITQQALGESAITVTDTTSLVAQGDSIINTENALDAWNKALIDRIGKTIISNKSYTRQRRRFFRSGIEYGIILQKIYTDLPKAVENQTWVSDNSKRKDQFEINLPNVRQYFFTGISSFEFPVTITDKAWKTAFTSATQMGAFVESIMTSLYNAMEVTIEETENLAVATFISEKYKAKDTHPNGAVNLLHDYNTLTNRALTVSQCLTDKEFLRYASMQINLLTKRMQKISTLYNNSVADDKGEKVKRFTSKEDLCLDVLIDFSTATASYLSADTFHKELVSLPNYNEVNYWQGSGVNNAFSDVSAVNIGASDNAISGILAVAYDVNAIGTTIENYRTPTERNNRGGYTNHFAQCDVQYFNDLSENGIVFYVEEV